MHQSKLIGLRILAVRFLAAVVTCGIWLVLSYSWKCFRNPETLRPGLLETAPEMGVELKSGAPVLRAPGAAGNGLTKTGVPFSFTTFTSSDGRSFFQWSESHRSAFASHRALNRALEKSIKTIRREPLLDIDGRRVGVKIVARFPSRSRYGPACVLWIKGSTFGYVTTSSMDGLLEYEKH